MPLVFFYTRKLLFLMFLGGNRTRPVAWNGFMYVFQQLIKFGAFPDKMKIVKVFPIFKFKNKSSLSNCCPISVLASFCKILERIMYNRIYKYLPENEILCKILLGFRAGHSTEYPVVEPIAQRSDSNPF